MKPAGLVKLSRWKKIIRKNEVTENKKAVDAGLIRARRRTAQKGGGDAMVEETIQTIRETEKKAEEIVKEAGRERERLLAEAKEKAADLKEEVIRKAQKAAEASAAEAKEKAAEAEKRAAEALEQEIGQLKASAKEKEQQAVDYVISHLV